MRRGEERRGYGRACLISFIQTNSSKREHRLERGSQHGVPKENAEHAIPKENQNWETNTFNNILIIELNKCH